MKKRISIIALLITLLPMLSAGITLNSPTYSNYNVGDNLDLLINILADPEINDLLTISLNCNNIKTEIYKEYISLKEDEKTRDITFPLIPELIGSSKGACMIEYSLGPISENLTEFKISDKITVKINDLKEEYLPGQEITIIGTAIKENGKPADGIIETQIMNGNATELIVTKIIKNGDFEIKTVLPENLKAGEHKLKLTGYEKNSQEMITNQGILETTISIKQIPVNLEIILDQTNLDPGTTLKGKIVLHDQTGEKINAPVYLSIKNEKKEIIWKSESLTDEEFEYKINETELPSTWEIIALSEELKSESSFTINEKRQIKIELTENLLSIKNTGNVIYEELEKIKIGEKIIELEIFLKIGQEEKYVLTAPNGEYVVEAGGESQTISLTGKAIDIKKLKRPLASAKPLLWIFLILILGFVVFTLFKKGYKKTFLGRKIKKPKKHSKQTQEIPELKTTTLKKSKEIINPTNKAEMSLSIHGNKQTAQVVVLHLKNYEHLKSGEGGIKETFTKITNISDEQKILTYNSKENLFFIFAPEITRTFKNEINALNFAEQIKKIIKNHNQIFKQKIDYGISIDSGEIVLKKDPTGIKFATMGTLMNNLKKIASHSKGEIYFTQKIREKLSKNIKVEKREFQKKDIYILTEVVQQIDHSKFIKGFMERLEKDRKKD